VPLDPMFAFAQSMVAAQLFIPGNATRVCWVVRPSFIAAIATPKIPYIHKHTHTHVHTCTSTYTTHTHTIPARMYSSVYYKGTGIKHVWPTYGKTYLRFKKCLS